MSLTDHTLIEYLALFSVRLQLEINYSEESLGLYVPLIYRPYSGNYVISQGHKWSGLLENGILLSCLVLC